LKCALFGSKWKTAKRSMIFLKCLNFTGFSSFKSFQDKLKLQYNYTLKLQCIQDEVLSVYCQNSSVIFKISLCIKDAKPKTELRRGACFTD